MKLLSTKQILLQLWNHSAKDTIGHTSAQMVHAKCGGLQLIGGVQNKAKHSGPYPRSVSLRSALPSRLIYHFFDQFQAKPARSSKPSVATFPASCSESQDGIQASKVFLPLASL